MQKFEDNVSIENREVNSMLNEAQVIDYIKKHKTVKWVASYFNVSRSTIYRVLNKNKITKTEVNNVYQGKDILNIVRNKNGTNKKEIIAELARCMECPEENVEYNFRYRFKMTLPQYRKNLDYIRKNQLTDIEFKQLKKEILLLIRMTPYTLKELCDSTKRTQAYVLAALKELPEVYGGYGKGRMKKGYFIATNEYEKILHDSWCQNWRRAMKYKK